MQRNHLYWHPTLPGSDRAKPVKDLQSHYENGVPCFTGLMNPSTGLPFRVGHFKLGKLTMAGVDTDSDGILDTRYRHGKRNEVVATERIQR